MKFHLLKPLFARESKMHSISFPIEWRYSQAIRFLSMRELQTFQTFQENYRKHVKQLNLTILTM